jgi:hypothetical protein
MDWVRFTRHSALAVLSAASVSPTAAFRQSLMAAAAVALHRRDVDGTVVASAEDLAELLATGAAQASPRAVDSYEPLDVRLGVRARWSQGLFRLAPGGWERPVSIVEEAKLLSRALDPTLDGLLGFGLADLAELILRHMDASLQRMSPHWSTGADAGMPVWEREAAVTDQEVDAAVADLDIASTVAACDDPVRAERALRWASCEPDQLNAAEHGQSATFGRVIAVRRGDDFEALPVGFMIDGLYGAMDALRAIALSEASAREALAAVGRRRVRHLVSGPGAWLAADADAGSGAIVALQDVDDGLLLAVDVVVAGVGGMGLAETEERLRAFVPAATVRTPRGEIRLDDDAEVVRLAVVVGPDSLMLFRGDDDVPVNVMPAEDLRWILSRADSRDELAVFLLDCQEPAEEMRFSFGTFDLWETWHGNDGAFHRLGAPLSMLMIEPHHERAEWIRHAELAWLEHSLLSLGLPGITNWPVVRPDKEGLHAATLKDESRNESVDVALLEDGTVIGVRFPLRTDSDVRPANIAHAILWKLRHIGAVVSTLVVGADPPSVRVEVRESLDLDGETLRVIRDRDVLVVEFDDAFGDELVEDADAAERRIGDALAAAAAARAEDRDAFVAAWASAPAGIAVDVSAPPQRACMLGSFQPPHGTFRARAERAAASRLLEAGVTPGMRRGTEARDLESRQIYPVLLDLFRDAVAPFNPTSVVRAALEDLERVHLGRWRDEGHLGRLTALASPGIDVTSRAIDARRESNVASRSLALAVEEVLRAPSSGDRVPRHLDLQRIYAVAYLLYESGMRSETIHQGVSGTELEITDSFELIARSAEVDFDAEAFNRAITTQAAPQRLTSDDVDDDADDVPARSIDEAWPETAGVDSALRAELGFGFHAMLCVIDTVTAWPVRDVEPVAAVSKADLVAEAADLTDCEPEELGYAVDWLTLRSADLQGELLEHWELDRRAVRLLSRPLVDDGSGHILLCPWAASMTRRVLLGHLSDGRLPWPQSALPNAVNKTLQQHRSSRNVALERAIITELSSRTHLKALGNIKKAKVLGLKVLPREIDGICLDERRGRIWVLEAKDRTIAFSPHQVRTAIDEFHEANGYIDKVLANVALIHASAESVVAAMGAANPGQQWDVRGLIVTRRIEPAAYVGQPKVLFCTADAVAQTIDSDTPPTRSYERLE